MHQLVKLRLADHTKVVVAIVVAERVVVVMTVVLVVRLVLSECVQNMNKRLSASAV
jgi:hypothetical protein